MAQGQELTRTGAEKFSELLKSKKHEFQKALQNNVDVGNFTRVALTTVQRNPKLLECTQASLFTSLIRIAQLGLVSDDILGQAYLIPFNDKRQGLIAEAVIGYQGYRQLALQSNKYKDIYSHVVFENDPFEISYGTDEFIKHLPAEEDPGGMRACYSIVVHNDGTRSFQFTWGKKIIAHRDQYSKSWKRSDSLWQTNPEMAWEKTMIKRLCKRLQLSTKAKEMINREDRMEMGMDMPIPDLDGGVIDVAIAEEDQGLVKDSKKDTGISGAENILDKKNADLKGKAGKIEQEVKKHVKQAPDVSQKDEMKTADLQDAIEEKLKGGDPKVFWMDSFDLICVQLFGDKAIGVKTMRKYDIGEMDLERLAKVWNRIK